MPKVTNPLPKRLKAARLALGLSQKALGIAAGIDEFGASARLNQYERGIHTPDYATANRLARVLKIPTAYLYANDDMHAELLLAFHALPVPARRKLLGSLHHRSR